MLWKEVKTWANYHGYKVDRTKVKEQENSYNYVWKTELCSGVAISTFDLAKDIYNHMNDYEYVEYQLDYQHKKTYEHIHLVNTY